MSGWDERIARARLLADRSPAASGILAFYAKLAEYQRQSSAVDLASAAQAIPVFLTWLNRHAPPPLARAAADGAGVPLERWRTLLEHRIETGELEEDDVVGFVVEAVLQPAVQSKKSQVHLKADTGYGRCPTCASRPVVGALREEGHGARRVLVCSLCAGEWNFPRVQCPACEESRFDALPVYTADTLGHVRIDACDTCQTYLKTVDLTRDALAVPVVDDLSTVPLDLWARERGYRRLYPNLLRL